jgi:hypothetical protein
MKSNQQIVSTIASPNKQIQMEPKRTKTSQYQIEPNQIETKSNP